jgi:hypothetical protein
MNVRLHIEELVLHGFAPGDRHRIARAVETELSRLFQEEGVPPGLADGGWMASLDCGSFEVASGAGPQHTGARVGQAIYRGLSR